MPYLGWQMGRGSAGAGMAYELFFSRIPQATHQKKMLPLMTCAAKPLM
jgi:hypothetical protein